MTQDRRTRQIQTLNLRIKELTALKSVGVAWLAMPEYQRRIAAKEQEIANLRQKLGHGH